MNLNKINFICGPQIIEIPVTSQKYYFYLNNKLVLIDIYVGD